MYCQVCQEESESEFPDGTICVNCEWFIFYHVRCVLCCSCLQEFFWDGEAVDIVPINEGRIAVFCEPCLQKRCSG